MKKITLSLFSSLCVMLLIIFTVSTNNINANDQISKVDCKCGLIWGDGCSASNYGNSCAPEDASFCSPYDSNCD